MTLTFKPEAAQELANKVQVMLNQKIWWQIFA